MTQSPSMASFRVVALVSSRDGVISFVVTLLATASGLEINLHSCGLSAEWVIGGNHGALYEFVASPEEKKSRERCDFQQL